MGAALESTVLAWSEEVDGAARVMVGLLDPFSGALTRVEALPPGAGEQLDPADVAWLGDRVAVVYQEKRAPDDWRIALALGDLGCGRDRCVDGLREAPDGACDGVDADCDGALDEDYLPVEACGVGRCRLESAPSVCLGGFEVECRPADPVDEVCGDGVDDDCDGRIDERCNGCPDGVVVPEGWSCAPAGVFVMGSGEGEFGRDHGFEDRREVEITRPFLVSRTEVTQGQWQALMGNNPSVLMGGATHPVDSVTWWDAAAYADRLSEAHGFEPCHGIDLDRCEGAPGEGEGLRCPVDRPPSPACEGFRLPTEAEWEYFARAGSRSAFWWGNQGARDDCAPDGTTDGLSWHCSNSDLAEPYPGAEPCGGWSGRDGGDALCGTHPVGVHIGMTPSPWGLYDVHGNVGEWVADWWRTGFVEPDPRDPIGPLAPEESDAACPLGGRVAGRMPCKGYRGGAYGSVAVSQASARRRFGDPAVRNHGRGFRLVRTLPEPPPPR